MPQLIDLPKPQLLIQPNAMKANRMNQPSPLTEQTYPLNPIMVEDGTISGIMNIKMDKLESKKFSSQAVATLKQLFCSSISPTQYFGKIFL